MANVETMLYVSSIGLEILKVVDGFDVLRQVIKVEDD